MNIIQSQAVTQSSPFRKKIGQFKKQIQHNYVKENQLMKHSGPTRYQRPHAGKAGNAQPQAASSQKKQPEMIPQYSMQIRKLFHFNNSMRSAKKLGEDKAEEKVMLSPLL